MTKQKNDNKKNISPKKFIPIIILMVITITTIFYVYNQYFTKTTSMHKKATKKYHYLTSNNWVSKDNKTINFSILGKFSYTDTNSGKAIDNSDKYTNFIYHNSKKLSIYGKGCRTTISILKLNWNTLKICFNNTVVTFKNTTADDLVEDSYTIFSSWHTCVKCNRILSEYVLYGHTTKLSNDSINCNEIDDTATKQPTYKEEYPSIPLAKDVKFYTLALNSEIIENDVLIKHDCSYKKLTIAEAKKLYGANNLEVYIFVNKKLEANRIIFFTQKTTKSNITSEEASKLIDERRKKEEKYMNEYPDDLDVYLD